MSAWAAETLTSEKLLQEVNRRTIILKNSTFVYSGSEKPTVSHRILTSEIQSQQWLRDFSAFTIVACPNCDSNANQHGEGDAIICADCGTFVTEKGGF